MSVVSAPGKIILLGEHAVVFGKPAIALAVGMRLRLRARRSKRPTVNGEPMTDRNASYIMEAIRQGGWESGYLSIEISSKVPSGSGLGSSAAVTVAALGAVRSMRGTFDQEAIARSAFATELAVQGRASPLDTSVVSHGHGIFVSPDRRDRLLWDITSGDRTWNVHHLHVPKLTMVIGYTGVRKPTGPAVAEVKKLVDRSEAARAAIDEIGQLTEDGAGMLRRGDLTALGDAMTRDQRLLASLGVSTKELEKLVDAAMPFSYGAKLTGAGCGGSMIALTDEPDKVCEAIRSRGGHPYLARIGVDGVRVEKR